MTNQDFFAASVSARRAALQREARASRQARQALRAGRRSARAGRQRASASDSTSQLRTVQVACGN